MGSKIATFIGVLLLGIGTICGPGLWLGAIACSYTAWQPGLQDAARVELLYAAFVFACWALWGLTTGLRTLPRVFLGLASILNMLTGFFVFVSDRPYGKPIGVLFLAYSLVQLIACRRPYVHYVN